MRKTILADVDGFTPLIDGLISELGLMSAVVFGRVWRFCQMGDRVCKASLETIGESIGVDRVTVMRHIKSLCEHGYVEDLTPDLKNRPHVYVDTGKAGLTLSLVGVAESNTKGGGVAQRNSGVAESHSTVAQRNSGVAESHLNIVFKKEIKKEFKREGGGRLEDVWERVKDQLESEMSKSVFDTYLQPSQLLGFEDGVMTICAENEASRAWLECRVATTAQRLLVGIMNQDVRVEFVVKESVI